MLRFFKKILLLVVSLIVIVCAIAMLFGEGGYNADDYDFGDYGSASNIEGTTVVVTIFASDDNGTWNMNSKADADLADKMHKYLGIACNWIDSNADDYDCEADFVYDWKSDDDLVYYADIDGDLTDDYDSDSLMWEYIDKYVDTEGIMDEYDADNVIYMPFLHTPASTETTSCTRNFYEGMECPYEMCFIYTRSEGDIETPAAIAHEMLHTFGAPDLYMADTDGDNYGITKKYVRYLEDNYSNDIMFTTYERYTFEPVYNRITNDFTEIDAYYVGMTDHSSVVDKWGFDPNQYEQGE